MTLVLSSHQILRGCLRDLFRTLFIFSDLWSAAAWRRFHLDQAQAAALQSALNN